MSAEFSLTPRLRTHEFSSKFRYNRFATSIGTRSAHAWVHIYATRTDRQKYLFDSVPQGRIDYVRSSLGATLNLPLFEILSYTTLGDKTQGGIGEKSDEKIYSKVNTRSTPPTPRLSILEERKKKKKKNMYPPCMISVPWLFWRLIFQRVFLASIARRSQKHIPYHRIAIQMYTTLLSISTSFVVSYIITKHWNLFVWIVRSHPGTRENLHPLLFERQYVYINIWEAVH